MKINQHAIFKKEKTPFIFNYTEEIKYDDKSSYQFNYIKNLRETLVNGSWLVCLDINDPYQSFSTSITKVNRETSDEE